ncbi:MAG: histidine kinase, partial [Bacteroidota bacterium]
EYERRFDGSCEILPQNQELCWVQNRILQHITFWLLFLLLNVVLRMAFAAPTDLAYPAVIRFFRFGFNEVVFLIWKALPFYFIFYYLLPKYLPESKYLQLSFFLLLTSAISIYGYRSMIIPMSFFLYNESPNFDVFSLNRAFYTLMDIIPVIGIAAAIKLLKGRTVNQRKIQALQEEKIAAELNFLKAQSNPHFLFNTLNNLYGLARKNDQNTATSIMRLSNIMRYILQECSSPTISIEKEVKVIEDYIALEKLRYDDRLKVTFRKEVEDWQAAVAPLILLPFVENAFKHGASETRFTTIIEIELKIENECLEFSVVNTRDSNEELVEKGTGLKNVSRQLELIYGENATLEIHPKTDQFTVNLEINLKTQLLSLHS